MVICDKMSDEKIRQQAIRTSRILIEATCSAQTGKEALGQQRTAMHNCGPLICTQMAARAFVRPSLPDRGRLWQSEATLK